MIGAFNEMMEELQLKTLQSRESEERYRKFIEMAQSAVVTFMDDGKIIISNQRAEELFGLSRQTLLGENIFSFLEDGEKLRDGYSHFSAGRQGRSRGGNNAAKSEGFSRQDDGSGNGAGRIHY